MAEVANGQKWRHKKRGSIYEIVAIDAAIQVSALSTVDDGVCDVLEDAVWIAYRPVNGHRLFFRMVDEFTDGRFELVEAAPD